MNLTQKVKAKLAEKERKAMKIAKKGYKCKKGKVYGTEKKLKKMLK